MFETASPRPMTDETVGQEIRRKGLTAPRITPAVLEEQIASEHYFTADPINFVPGQMISVGDKNGHAHKRLHLLTFCVLVLRNGFTVTGESACASQMNFDAELGRRIARENAKQKMRPLLGYALCNQLAEGK